MQVIAPDTILGTLKLDFLNLWGKWQNERLSGFR
jgi:hypothetical protein